MAFVVHLVGWTGPAPSPDPRWRYVHLRAGELEVGVPVRLVVLGPEGLARTGHEAVRRWLRGGPRRLVLCLETSAVDRLAPWLEIGARLVSPQQLAEGIETCARELALGLVRWPLDPMDWLPPGTRIPADGSLAAGALRVLPDVHPVHDVEAWARSLDVSYGQLRRALLRDVGAGSSELYLAFARAQAAAAELDGVSRWDIARMLGYADPSGLGHAILRADALEREHGDGGVDPTR